MGAGGLGTSGTTGASGGSAGSLGSSGSGGSVDAGGSLCSAGQCRRVFISATAVSNPIGGVASADSRCQSFADARNLGGTWKAWISDTGSASARLAHAVVPYRLLDGTLVANNWDDLIDGSLAHRIDMDETGATASGGLDIWTGTDAAGAAFLDGSCANWTNATANNPLGAMGRSDAVNQDWTQSKMQTCDRTTPHLYCFEQGAGPSSGPPAPANCPSSMDFTSPVPTVRYGDIGGTYHPRLCPAGQVAIGFNVFERANPAPAVVSGLVAICGRISISPSTCQVTIPSATNYPLDGTSGDSGTVNRRCPADTMVVTVRGRSGQFMDQIGFGCAPLTLSKVGSSYQANVGAVTSLPAVGGTGGGAYTSPCPAGQVATGSAIHADTVLNAFSLFCATPILLP